MMPTSESKTFAVSSKSSPKVMVSRASGRPLSSFPLASITSIRVRMYVSIDRAASTARTWTSSYPSFSGSPASYSATVTAPNGRPEIAGDWEESEELIRPAGAVGVPWREADLRAEEGWRRAGPVAACVGVPWTEADLTGDTLTSPAVGVAALARDSAAWKGDDSFFGVVEGRLDEGLPAVPGESFGVRPRALVEEVRRTVMTGIPT